MEPKISSVILTKSIRMYMFYCGSQLLLPERFSISNPPDESWSSWELTGRVARWEGNLPLQVLLPQERNHRFTDEEVRLHPYLNVS